MPSTFVPLELVLLAAGREPSGFARFFYHVTKRFAPFRCKVNGIELNPRSGVDVSSTSLKLPFPIVLLCIDF